MPGMPSAGEGRSGLGSRTVALLARAGIASLAARLASAARRAEARRQLDELSRMSREQLARLELSRNDLIDPAGAP